LLVVAPDGRPGSVPLTLRPLVNEDTPALQEMLDDPGVREVMGWRDDEYRDAGLVIDGLQDEQIDFYRYRYTFGIVPDHADTLAGVAIVTIGQAEPAQFPPAWQTDLTIFFAQQFRRLGYGRRTLTMLRNWCFEELRLTSPFGESVRMSKVTAVCLPGNEAARDMLSDLLAPQGATVLKHKTDGSPVEALLFSMTREQYEANETAGQAADH
jgi:RimJ/RimL family protein N-acetyltransferase